MKIFFRFVSFRFCVLFENRKSSEHITKLNVCTSGYGWMLSLGVCHFIKFSYWGRLVFSAIALLRATALLLCSHISHIIILCVVRTSWHGSVQNLLCAVCVCEAFLPSFEGIVRTFSFPHWLRLVCVLRTSCLVSRRIICWHLRAIRFKISHAYGLRSYKMWETILNGAVYIRISKRKKSPNEIWPDSQTISINYLLTSIAAYSSSFKCYGSI